MKNIRKYVFLILIIAMITAIFSAQIMAFAESVFIDCPGVTPSSAFLPHTAIGESGNIYVAYKDVNENSKATVRMYDGTGWSIVGNSGFSTTVGLNLLVKEYMGAPVVAYLEKYSNFGNGYPCVMMFNGENWVSLGSQKLGPLSTVLDLQVFNNELYVSYHDGSSTVIKKWDGSSWVTPFPSIGHFVGTYSLTFDSSGTPYMLLREHTSTANNLTVYRYNGSSWVTVGGTSFAKGTNPNIALDSNGVPYVFSYDSPTAQCYRYNAATGQWESLIPEGTTLPYNIIKGFVHNGVPAMLVVSTDTKQLGLLKYNGSGWEPFGPASISYAASPSGSNANIIIRGNESYITYFDSLTGNQYTILHSDDLLPNGSSDVEDDDGGLDDAIAGIDKTALGVAIRTCLTLNSAEYTAESWALVLEKLNYAVKIYNLLPGDKITLPEEYVLEEAHHSSILAESSPSQLDVDRAKAELLSALNGLEGEKRELIYAVDEAVSSVDNSLFDDISWNNLLNTIDQAKAVAANPNVSQEDLNDAVNSLIDAINNLKAAVTLPQFPDTYIIDDQNDKAYIYGTVDASVISAEVTLSACFHINPNAAEGSRFISPEMTIKNTSTMPIYVDAISMQTTSDAPKIVAHNKYSDEEWNHLGTAETAANIALGLTGAPEGDFFFASESSQVPVRLDANLLSQASDTLGLQAKFGLSWPIPRTFKYSLVFGIGLRG